MLSIIALPYDFPTHLEIDSSRFSPNVELPTRSRIGQRRECHAAGMCGGIQACSEAQIIHWHPEERIHEKVSRAAPILGLFQDLRSLSFEVSVFSDEKFAPAPYSPPVARST